MKRFVKSGTNTTGVPATVTSIEAADTEVEETLEDKLSVLKDDFDYIIEGIHQLDVIEGNPIVDDLHADLQGFIQDIANILAE